MSYFLLLTSWIREINKDRTYTFRPYGSGIDISVSHSLELLHG